MTRPKSKTGDSPAAKWAWAYALASLGLLLALGLAWRMEVNRPWKIEVAAINARRGEMFLQRALAAGLDTAQVKARAAVLTQQPARVVEVVPAATGQPERCLTCHQGIEEISPSHPVEAVGCVSCHGGDGLGLTKASAHRGLLGRNPSELPLLAQSCGRAGAGFSCHGENRPPAADMAYRVPRTIMATMTGVISSLRAAWGAQKDFTARLATSDISDPRRPSPAPEHTVAALQAVPGGAPPAAPLANEHWRKFCARCHLRAERPQGQSVHGLGCAACHGSRREDGRYQGADAAIRRDEPGHAALHRLQAAPPGDACRRCHNRSGRVGLNYQGWMEDEGGAVPWPQGKPQWTLSGGRGVRRLLPDVHAAKGLDCLDCHSGREIMGDGRLYGRMRHQTELTCATCHGDRNGPPKSGPADEWASYEARYGPLGQTANKYGGPMLLSTKGRPLYNLRIGPKGPVLLSRSRPGQAHPVPQVAGDPRHNLPGHKRLACQACHSRWVPQCYGCHDRRLAKGELWDYAAGKPTPGGWQESRDLYRFMNPVLGLDSRGLITTFAPGCQVILTQLNQQGRPTNGPPRRLAKTKAVGSGIVSTPVAPHTTRTEARPCESCHLNPKALGLGGGPRPLSSPAALPLADLSQAGFPADWEALVGPKGEILQGNTHQGARPLNLAEAARVLRFARCLPCHRLPADPVLKDPAKAYARVAPGGDLFKKHQAMEEKALK